MIYEILIPMLIIFFCNSTFLWMLLDAKNIFKKKYALEVNKYFLPMTILSLLASAFLMFVAFAN